ncbi:MAG: methylated-DNA--[protein]-cysteine S-methyltransferase [Muribaculaceae bacterium]|nr:methylated-DNA--[protein]-cysteine S-methyltransferase [Muribaculaceae bacterium]
MLFHYYSPIGLIETDIVDDAVERLYFIDHEPDDENMLCNSPLPVAQVLYEWLDSYFEGESEFVERPLIRLGGTDFQLAVWREIILIPYGEIWSYSDIAERLCKDETRARYLARAVGMAAGRNPVWLLVPCHRVIGKNGRLYGYAGGVMRKAWLLCLESENTF